MEKKTMTISITIELYQKLKNESERTGIPMSVLVRRSLVKYFGKVEG